MVLAILSAVGGCVQVVKTLYEYYDLHKRNKALLDILEGFSQNLEISIQRLKVREILLVGSENPALDSIEKDFDNAKNWLLTNDKNLRSFWTALQAADKLKDLDDRLTKAFASKMAVAIFSALQDTRHATTKIQTTLDGMTTNLEVVCREATRSGIQEAIVALKEEAYQATGGGMGREKGFRNGEAEKIISLLVDQLSAQERIKEEEEARAAFAAGYPPLMAPMLSSSAPVPYRSSSRGPPIPYSSIPSTSHQRSMSGSSPFDPTPSTSGGSHSDQASLFSRRPGHTATTGSVTSVTPSSSIRSIGSNGQPRERKDKIPVGSIVFNPRDPFTNADLIDPVLANDGLIHDRWTLIEGKHDNMRDPSEPLLIVGDVVQLREAIFTSFPSRRTDFQDRRQAYREETLRLYETTGHSSLPSIINRLSHILLWEPTSVSLRIRRGIARYRLRDLAAAHQDLTEAIKFSMRGLDGTEGLHKPDLDALRARALVRGEMHDNDAAMLDLNNVLLESPHDILALSLRAALRGNAGDLIGAQADLGATNLAITNDQAYRSRIGDSDCDLEYLARGWAYTSLRDYESARADFDYSLGLRNPPEPYTLACRGLAKVKHELEAGAGLDKAALAEGLADLAASIELNKRFAAERLADVEAPVEKYASGAAVGAISKDGLPVQAFACFFLSGSARFSMGDFETSLEDFETGIRLRPDMVKDTGPFRAALAEMRVECGDRDGAAKDFDYAIALDPGNRFAYTKSREEYGV